MNYDADAGSGSVFSKAAFVADDSTDMDMDDPEFWTKVLPEMQQVPTAGTFTSDGGRFHVGRRRRRLSSVTTFLIWQVDPEEAEALLRKGREKRQVKRFGMADDGEVEGFLEEETGVKRRKGEPRSRADDDARRAARRALSHIWSKTERNNCERALLGFGFGRWSRMKYWVGGQTRLRDNEEIERFAIAFVCLCLGVPVGGTGGTGGTGTFPEQEAENIAKAKELIKELGGEVPRLTQTEVAEIEPTVSISAGGAEYAETSRDDEPR